MVDEKMHTNGGWLVVWHGRIRKISTFIQTKVLLPQNLTWNLKITLLEKEKHLQKLHVWVPCSFSGGSRSVSPFISSPNPTFSIACALRAVRPDATFDISHRHWWPPSKPPRWPNAVAFFGGAFHQRPSMFLGAPVKTKHNKCHQTNPLKKDYGCLHVLLMLTFNIFQNKIYKSQCVIFF